VDERQEMIPWKQTLPNGKANSTNTSSQESLGAKYNNIKFALRTKGLIDFS